MQLSSVQVRPFRVLVADDNGVVRTVVGTMVKRMGFTQVDYAMDGMQALGLHRANRYELILLDNDMPGMTGAGFLRTCREEGLLAGTSVIMVTAVADESLIREAVGGALKIDDLIVKPFSMQALKDKVDHTLARQKQRIDTHPQEIEDVLKGLPEGDCRCKMGSNLSYSIASDGNMAALILSGQMTSGGRDVMNSLCKAVLDLTEEFIVIDCSNVNDIDEYGFGTMMVANGIAFLRGKKLALVVVPQAQIRERIESLLISKVIPVLGHIPWVGRVG